MGPTTKAMSAMTLGMRIAMHRWRTYAKDYAKNGRRDILKFLKEIGLEGVDIPAKQEDLVARHNEVVDAILSHLGAERARIGGDCYALPFFMLTYCTHRAITHAALDGTVEDEVSVLTATLSDLDIDADRDGVMKHLRAETAWVKQLPGGDVRAGDITAAWHRMLSRCLQLWGEARRRRAEDLPPISLDDRPTYSCFVSYSHDDEKFGRALYERLRDHAVQVWYAPESMRGGEKGYQQIHDAMQTHDKLLLVLSNASMQSSWVDHELKSAFARQRKEKTQMLFPIRICPLPQVKRWSAFDADSGTDLAREIREYHILDFTRWRTEDAFDRAVSVLMDSLRRVAVTAPAKQPRKRANRV